MIGLGVGFLIGFLFTKIRNRWCPACGGSTLTLRPERDSSADAW
ncbi:hypothetical protein [Pilimelia anulata]|nr:hypothetical protein [Pilimelia anulata]